LQVALELWAEEHDQSLAKPRSGARHMVASIRVGDVMTTIKGAVFLRLTGYVIGWSSRGPALLRSTDGSERYLPVFSSVDKLTDFATSSGWPTVEVKKITQGRDFIDLVPTDIVIIVDPHFTAEGRLRYVRRIVN
jgi:hypothetical protein